MLESEERTARDMEPDIKMIDTYLYEIRDIDKTITLESSKLKGISMFLVFLLYYNSVIFNQFSASTVQGSTRSCRKAMIGSNS